MKRLTFSIALAASIAAVSGPALACQGEHGYKKTADALMQSTLSTEKKAALMQLIKQSEMAHDKFTAHGEYVKMNAAVLELGQVRSALGK